MSGFDMLLIEWKGIYKGFRVYVQGTKADDYFHEMYFSCRRKDKESVLYCMEQIFTWYERHIIPKIEEEKQSQYFDKDGFTIFSESLDKLKEMREAIKKEESSVLAVQPKADSKKLVFISHKSDDKKYGDALRNYLTGLGLRDDQLIYTSHPLNGIPLGENIYEYLRKNIHAGIFMIILWSNKYLESPACLNEMGAAWVVQADYTNVYVPTFSFGNPKYHECAVDTRKMGAVLNGDQHCKASMIELKNKIQQMFGLQDEEKRSSYLLDRFIEEIQ